MKEISVPSVRSVFLRPMRSDRVVSAGATGFLVESEGRPFLITNWHVLSGRNQLTFQPNNPSGELPDSIEITHHDKVLGNLTTRIEPLYNRDEALWLEHPSSRRHVDVVALPLTQIDGVQLYTHDVNPKPMPMQVTNTAFIVGFPYGVKVGNFTAVWTAGTIASEPQIDFEGLPILLVDGKTRSGQSGSPVIRYVTPGSWVVIENGLTIAQTEIIELIGVYSGRINEKSDLGKIWKVSALREILQSGVAGNGEYLDPNLPVHPTKWLKG